MKKTVENIAIFKAKEVVDSAMLKLTSEINKANTSPLAEVVSVENGNEFKVKLSDGTEKTVKYLGDRPVGPKSNVVMKGDFAT